MANTKKQPAPKTSKIEKLEDFKIPEKKQKAVVGGGPKIKYT